MFPEFNRPSFDVRARKLEELRAAYNFDKMEIHIHHPGPKRVFLIELPSKRSLSKVSASLDVDSGTLTFVNIESTSEFKELILEEYDKWRNTDDGKREDEEWHTYLEETYETPRNAT